MRVVMLLSQCSGGDSLRITLIIALALTLFTFAPLKSIKHFMGKKFPKIVAHISYTGDIP